MIRSLELISRLRATSLHHQAARMALKKQRHLVVTPAPVHHPSLWWGNQHLTALRLQYCLEIQVISTKEGELHHHLHMPGRCQLWKTWSEMANAGLTEAVVTGPGWAILFYGQWSVRRRTELGWGIKMLHVHPVRSHQLVGKQAQLNANLVSLGEGQCSWSPKPSPNNDTVKPRGPRHPHSILPASSPFNFWTIRTSQYGKQGSQLLLNDGRYSSMCWAIIPGMRPSLTKRPRLRLGAKGELWAAPPHHLCPCQIVGLRVTEVQHQLPHQCHQGLIDLEVPGIHTTAWWCHRESGGHMKINLPVFKDEDTKDAITCQSWHWDLTVYHCAGCSYCTLLPYAIHSLQGYSMGVGEKFGDRHHPAWWYSPYWMSITTMSRP